ncbi:hypothetical protein NDU88_004978 [Pleurodeles waltl]|uniref:Uncharacterized protein n=1 Tax=Pleurodeles waltl TaxID=8319 RepID=A0AAV7L1E6_PLEWA|nr:hypothetical protein NDU88_004978 [Pleurodeles waltl]
MGSCSLRVAWELERSSHCVVFAPHPQTFTGRFSCYLEYRGLCIHLSDILLAKWVITAHWNSNSPSDFGVR